MRKPYTVTHAAKGKQRMVYGGLVSFSKQAHVQPLRVCACVFVQFPMVPGRPNEQELPPADVIPLPLLCIATLPHLKAAVKLGEQVEGACDGWVPCHRCFTAGVELEPIRIVDVWLGGRVAAHRSVPSTIGSAGGRGEMGWLSRGLWQKGVGSDCSRRA